jgi:hypothetical protein
VGASVHNRWRLCRADARTSHGRVDGVNCAAIDLSDRKRAESHLPVQKSNRRHLGRILLDQVVPIAVQGNASLKFESSGIGYCLTMPTSELIA